ncbi:DUF6282 family protein [Psychrobacter immobilis]|uniref:DUF6282 family protein n=1 Tax=Psychrobacter immobilis TaxID=498 RepID=UPI001918DAB4|nr:DUF6282 family protein [Psychrobacter immobilis]
MAILVRVGIDFNTVDQLCDFLDVQVKQNDWELLEDAKQATMHGIVIKLHESQTYDRATLLNLKQKDVKVICGLVLNHFSGGLNPFTVDAVIQ